MFKVTTVGLFFTLTFNYNNFPHTQLPEYLLFWAHLDLCFSVLIYRIIIYIVTIKKSLDSNK